MTDALITRIELAAAKITGITSEGGAPPSVSAYNAFYAGSVQPFVDVANKNADTKNLGAMTEAAFKHVAVVIEAATACKKPSDADFMSFVGPIAKVLGDCGNCDNRSAFFNHQKGFEAAAASLNWIMVPGPKTYIEGELAAADFYLMKVLTGAKAKAGEEQQNDRDFVKLLKQMLKDMAAYAQEYHKMGIVWNAKGGAVGSFKAGGNAEKKQTADERLTAIAQALEAHVAKNSVSEDGKHPSVAAYEELCATALKDYQNVLGTSTFAEKKVMLEWITTAFEQQGKVIAARLECAKPSDEDFMAFLAPIVKVIQDSGNPDNRGAFFNHEKAFNECIQGLSWIMMPGPKAFIENQRDSADMYLNRVLVAAKNMTGDDQANNRAYVKTLKALYTALAEYAHEYHKQGLIWKHGGAALKDFK